MIFGFDPGKNTGVAMFEDGKLTSLQTIKPSEYALLLGVDSPELVVIEDSRMQSHVFTGKGLPHAAQMKVARNVGSVDAWCYLIEALCDELSIPLLCVSPKGKGAKIKAGAFKQITGWEGRTNGHTRDAAMVAWMYRRGAKQ